MTYLLCVLVGFMAGFIGVEIFFIRTCIRYGLGDRYRRLLEDLRDANSKNRF